ncbi:MAG TPA: hypothetical protein VM779_05230 [Thermoanaerobaculia bacterium]|nr:hypothetical protein [Thermoanaerobaculia bacterium]
MTLRRAGRPQQRQQSRSPTLPPAPHRAARTSPVDGIAGQECLYNVWSAHGEEHLESLIGQIRFVR